MKYSKSICPESENSRRYIAGSRPVVFLLNLGAELDRFTDGETDSVIKVICGWCGKFLRYKCGQPGDMLKKSHGICDPCKNKLLKEVKQ